MYKSQNGQTSPTFKYWFDTTKSSQSTTTIASTKNTIDADDNEGKFVTIDKVRVIKELEDTAKHKLKDFFQNYSAKATDLTDTEKFIMNFLTNELPSVLVQGCDTFNPQSPLYGRKDWLAMKIQLLVSALFQAAHADSAKEIITNPALVKDKIVQLLQAACLLSEGASPSEEKPERDMTASMYAGTSPSIQQSVEHNADIAYIIEVLNKGNLAPSSQSALSRFKATIANWTPSIAGVRKSSENCKSTFGSYSTKFMPTREGIKKFICYYQRPILGLTAMGGLLLAWFYMPAIPEVNRQQIRQIGSDYSSYIGGAIGGLLTIVVFSLFNWCRTPSTKTSTIIESRS